MRRTVARVLTALLLVTGAGVVAAPAANAGGCDTIYYSNGWSQRCWGFSGTYRITATCQPHDLARKYVVVGEWRQVRRERLLDGPVQPGRHVHRGLAAVGLIGA